MNFQVPYKAGNSITSPAFLKTRYHVLGESVTGNKRFTDGLEGKWEKAHVAYFNTFAAKHHPHCERHAFIHFIMYPFHIK
jgi:hypothetical protein